MIPANNVALDRAQTITEASASTGYHRNTLLRWIHEGRIPAARVGRWWRIPPEVVHAMKAGIALPGAQP